MNDKILYGLNALEYASVITQANEIFQLVQLILTIATTLFILLIKIISWYNKSKKDGKIDASEVKEAAKIIEDGTKKVKSQIDEEKKGGGKNG